MKMKAARLLSLLALLLIAAPASAATLASDNFNRADANPIGGNWTTIPGGLGALQIVGNEVRGTATSSRNGAYYNAVSAPNDQWASILIVTTGVASSDTPCPAIRISASVETYYANCPFVGGGGDLIKRVSGTFTSIAGSATSWSVGNTFKVEAQGTTIKGFINGVEDTSVTDATIAAGQFGIMLIVDGTLANTEADDWMGGDFTGGSATPRRRVIVVD